jgi:hypothetical protein
MDRGGKSRHCMRYLEIEQKRGSKRKAQKIKRKRNKEKEKKRKAKNRKK